MSPQDFINKYNGKGVDIDGMYGFQCVDLFDQYLLDVIGVGWYPVVSAKDIWTNPNTDKYFDKITSGIPQLGDVVVWGISVGYNGHVAIATGVGDFQTLDQNWPWGLADNFHPASLNNHNHNGVIGWLRKKGLTMSQYDDLVNVTNSLDRAIKDIWKTDADIISQLSIAQGNIDAIYKTVNEINKKLDNPVSIPAPIPQFDPETATVLQKIANFIEGLFKI